MFQPLGGVAVIADNSYAAFKGRKSLKIEWDSSSNEVYNSGPFRKTLEATSRKPCKVVRNVGDVDATFAQSAKAGGKIIDAEYYTPHLAHASMEPPVAVAEYRDGKVLAWAPTQNPQAVQETIAGVLGIKKEDVTCHVTLLGGGFGRKSKPDQVAEAAVLSKQLGKPVQGCLEPGRRYSLRLFPLRRRDVYEGRHRRRWQAHGLLQRTVYPPIGSTFDTKAYTRTTKWAWDGTIFLRHPQPSRREWPATITSASDGCGSGNIYHAFAIHSFADELAHNAKKDRSSICLI